MNLPRSKRLTRLASPRSISIRPHRFLAGIADAGFNRSDAFATAAADLTSPVLPKRQLPGEHAGRHANTKLVAVPPRDLCQPRRARASLDDLQPYRRETM
jgi:hypothetical protein